MIPVVGQSPASHRPDATPHEITLLTRGALPTAAGCGVHVCTRVRVTRAGPSYHISPDSTWPSIARLCSRSDRPPRFGSSRPVTGPHPQDKFKSPSLSFWTILFKVNCIFICRFSIDVVPSSLTFPPLSCSHGRSPPEFTPFMLFIVFFLPFSKLYKCLNAVLAFKREQRSSLVFTD